MDPLGPLDDLCIQTLRFLAVDAVEQARSGHPGAPLGAAPSAYVLWARHLRHNPADPRWPNRDRFVLSMGHASMLLYGLLYLFGYPLTIEEIQQFRQWGSRTPGHPEYDPQIGVEMTTGPLGQGFASAVGMAVAEKYLAALFNRPGYPIMDHYTYVMASDGDLMEGINHEAASLAGHWRLGKLIVLYDANGITIDGPTHLAFTENVALRYQAYGWHVQEVGDGNDLIAIDEAIRQARDDIDHPSLIIVRSHIGFGSPRQDSERAHGEPLGTDAVRATKDFFGWPQEPRFFVPEGVLKHARSAQMRGRELQRQWENLFTQWSRAYPELAEIWQNAWSFNLPDGWDKELYTCVGEPHPMATREASGRVINALTPHIPFLIGGSADLTGSNKTRIENSEAFQADNPTGRNFHFGVREHAMGALLNGLLLHGGLRAFGGTFLVFSDYMRPTIRLAAMMRQPVIYIFSHDSIGLGEDGPTHQPVEHLTSLRAIPGLWVIRPADALETAAAWSVALQRTDGPVALCLTRQKVPSLGLNADVVHQGVQRGAYIVADSNKLMPDVILIATGSEVHLALQARHALEKEGIRTRVVSMPCWELFDGQPDEYKETILPRKVQVRVAIEAGCTLAWKRWVGDNGSVIGLDRFGASAPAPVVMERLGFNVSHVLQVVHNTLKAVVPMVF